jgi:two-component system chemotaxis response regulator CheY
MSADVSLPILVVEDSTATGRVICGLLKHLGFEKVDLAHGGTTALAKMRKAGYGLVISDWNMHPITGLDLLRQMRSEASFAKAKFIMMTAEASMDHVVAAKAAGVDNFIVKPFTAQVLKEKIESVLADRAGSIVLNA